MCNIIRSYLVLMVVCSGVGIGIYSYATIFIVHLHIKVEDIPCAYSNHYTYLKASHNYKYKHSKVNKLNIYTTQYKDKCDHNDTYFISATLVDCLISIRRKYLHGCGMPSCNCQGSGMRASFTPPTPTGSLHIRSE